MKPAVRITLLSLTACLVVGYLAFFVFHGATKEVNTVCNQLEILIADKNEFSFVSEQDILRLLSISKVDPRGKCYTDFTTAEIVSAVRENELVREVSCYRTIQGKVVVKIKQRIPFLRVAGNENYYVDIERQIMPVTFTTATYVPVITGRVLRSQAQNELFDFVQYLQASTFWSSQIVQIHINTRSDIVLIPRIGEYRIILGTLQDYEKKLNKLYRFYKDYAIEQGFPACKEVDLRYKGQIICRPS